MKILILAGGEKYYDGWEGDCLRQMAPVAGEPLLLRTLRELGERGHTATVVTDEPQIKEAVLDHFHSDEETIWDAMLSTKVLWQGDVLVLLGDVFYRKEHWKVIFDYAGDTPVCFDSLACLFSEKDYDRTVVALKSLAWRGEPFFNLLWREGYFPKIETASHIDFDIVPYYKKFLEDNPWARPPVLIVLAAGDADRLSAVFDGPKALLEFGGRTLLERILDAFAEIGIAEAVVVVGHRADEVGARTGDRRGGMSVDYVVEEDFADTLTGDGLLSAKDRWLDRACFVVSGDHLFHRGLVTDVCRRMPPDSILVDPSAPLDGEETVLVRAEGEEFLVWPGSIAVGEILGESPEIFRFSPEGTQVVADHLEGRDVFEAANRLGFTYHETGGHPWIEIDTPEDLERAKKLFEEME